MVDGNEKQAQEEREAVDPALKEFIDEVIVPILVREYLKEARPLQASQPASEIPSTAPKTGKS